MSDDINSIEQPTPQNIYDETRFFEGYKALRQNDTGLNGALELPALHRLLPDLSNLHVLDLGCGFGDFARFARKGGAASVTGIDVSARMLDEAARLTSDPAVSYWHGAIEDYVPAAASFDLVVSSLALHYVKDYAGVVGRIFQALKGRGRFVFSVEHPMCTANPAGWIRDENGRQLHWPVDNYRLEGERKTHWFVDGVIKYHRTIETYVNTLVGAGFQLEHLGEPEPSHEALMARPTLQAECRRPPFLFLAAVRPSV